MTDEPYRWLEAVANRREYVQAQLKGGTPVFAASLREGVLLLGVGTGQSKVFELFERHALAGLGHPADLEKLRQAAIDAAHLEAFTRAPEDVTLRRLVSYGLGPQLKAAFEQIFAAPFLVKLLLAEAGAMPADDVLVRLTYDGTYHLQHGGVLVAADDAEAEAAAQDWLAKQALENLPPAEAAHRLLECWWCLREKQPPGAAAATEAWRKAAEGRVIEAAVVGRGRGRNRYQPLAVI